MWTILSMVGLGIALVLGCLFAFPYARIWLDEDPGVGGPVTGEERRAGVRLIGVATLQKLILDKGVDPAEG
jgi:hypothetical protein